MITINVSWTFGNFDPMVEVSAEINGEKAKEILEGYALQVLQRKPASAVEKTLAKYNKRPEGFKRDSIPYSEESVAVVKKGFTLDLGNGVSAVCTSVIEHVKGEIADTKFTEEKEIAGRHESADDLVAWLRETVKFEGLTHDMEGEFNVEMLRSVRAYKIARLAEIRKGI